MTAPRPAPVPASITYGHDGARAVVTVRQDGYPDIVASAPTFNDADSLAMMHFAHRHGLRRDARGNAVHHGDPA